jgi:hypothetical protein
MDKTFTLPENKNEEANMNGVKTRDIPYIVRCLNEEICKYVDFEVLEAKRKNG